MRLNILEQVGGILYLPNQWPPPVKGFTLHSNTRFVESEYVSLPTVVNVVVTVVVVVVVFVRVKVVVVVAFDAASTCFFSRSPLSTISL